MGAYSSICDEDLGQWARVTSSFSSHSLDGVHRGAWCTRGGSEYWGQPGRVKHLGRWHRGGGCEKRDGGTAMRLRWSHAHVQDKRMMTFRWLTMDMVRLSSEGRPDLYKSTLG